MFNIIKFLKGAVFVALVYFTTIPPVLMSAWFLFPIHFSNLSVIRFLRDSVDRIITSWMHLVASLMETLLGLRVVVTGDRLESDEQSVIIMNHRTCLDWMFFFSVLARQSGVANEKIVLKSSLKSLPGPGWCMQTAAFLFVERSWDVDESYLNTMLNYYRDLKYKTQILVFPEGTDFCAKSQAKSDLFAEKHGLQPYTHVLHPRTTGFTYLVTYMKHNWSSESYVYDVTVAYPADSIPHDERDLLRGNLPSVVHFHVKRHAVSSLPDQPDALDAWCRNVWSNKENSLERFTQTCSLLPETDLFAAGRSAVIDDGADLSKLASADETNGKEDGFEIIGKPLHDVSEKDSDNTQLDLVEQSSPLLAKIENYAHDNNSRLSTWRYVEMIGWILFLFFYLFLLWWSLFFLLFSLMHVIFFLVMDLKYGGFELYQARLVARRVKKSQ